MNMQAIAEQMRQQLLDAAHQQYQDMVKTINAMFGVDDDDDDQTAMLAAATGTDEE